MTSNFSNILIIVVNPLKANHTKWPNTLKQFVGNLPTNCLSVLGHSVKLAFKVLSENKVVFIDSLRH